MHVCMHDDASFSGFMKKKVSLWAADIEHNGESLKQRGGSQLTCRGISVIGNNILRVYQNILIISLPVISQVKYLSY